MELLDYEREHLETLRPLLPECTVLLKSDGSFPLSEPGELVLFGSGARRTVKGGTGSGEVNSRFFTTVEDGLRQAGFRITTEAWLDAYDREREKAKQAFLQQIHRSARQHHVPAILEGMGKVMPEWEYEIPLDGAGETAVYVLARISGEGNDRENIPGDLQLTGTEIRDILELQERFPRFLLVLNVGGPMDLTPVADEVNNILLLSQLGVETGAALADILLGKANPSGKLTTTWAASADLPQIGDFGEKDDTRYREGIYVGYRYYDSAGVTPLFPFGHGLSYSAFEVSGEETVLEGEEVCVHVTVKNTGAFPGKETLQLYVSKPEVKLDQPFQVLAAFQKSGELVPEAEEVLALRFRMSELASYDAKRACYVLEKGDYFLRLGTSSADTRVIARIRLEQETVTASVKNCCGVTDFADWKPKLERIDMFPPEVPILELDPQNLLHTKADYNLPENIEEDVGKLSREQLIQMNVGAYDPKGGVLSVIGDAAFSVAGAAGETCGVSRELGLKPLVMADGPAGLRLSRDYVRTDGREITQGAALPETMEELLPKPAVWLMGKLGKKPPKDAETLHRYATAIPIGTAIAQSWNLELAKQCGDLVGDEMERMGVDLWLAPALNIHRDVRCGRNFEYFSEDPLISGSFAAAITEGVQKHPGRGTTIKHYAANNQEYNRYNSNSIVSERAMREIYLRGFEICIRRSQPHALMTSYNLLNGVHTSEHTGLLHDLLRCEFGYRGLIMTDWVIAGMSSRKTLYPKADAGRVAAAGGELFMPGSKGDADSIRKALESGKLSEDRLRKNVSGLIRKLRELQEAQRV